MKCQSARQCGFKHPTSIQTRQKVTKYFAYVRLKSVCEGSHKSVNLSGQFIWLDVLTESDWKGQNPQKVRIASHFRNYVSRTRNLSSTRSLSTPPVFNQTAHFSLLRVSNEKKKENDGIKKPFFPCFGSPSPFFFLSSYFPTHRVNCLLWPAKSRFCKSWWTEIPATNTGGQSVYRASCKFWLP